MTKFTELKTMISNSSPLPWRWFTSNSMNRLTSANGKDGDVLHAFRAADGVPCISVRASDMLLIENAINLLPELLAYIDAQTSLIDEMQRYRAGWKLVPVEPTERMIIDGFESEPDKFFSDPADWDAYNHMSGCKQAAHRAKLCWAAMIAAAPEPEVKKC